MFSLIIDLRKCVYWLELFLRWAMWSVCLLFIQIMETFPKWAQRYVGPENNTFAWSRWTKGNSLVRVDLQNAYSLMCFVVPLYFFYPERNADFVILWMTIIGKLRPNYDVKVVFAVRHLTDWSTSFIYHMVTIRKCRHLAHYFELKTQVRFYDHLLSVVCLVCL